MLLSQQQEEIRPHFHNGSVRDQSSSLQQNKIDPDYTSKNNPLLFYINYEKNSLFLSFSSVGKKDYFRLKEWVWVGGRQLMICEDKELIELYPPSLFSYIHSSGERGIHRQATGIFTDRQQGCS